jgi:hypothetical protein
LEFICDLILGIWDLNMKVLRYFDIGNAWLLSVPVKGEIGGNNAQPV